MHCCDIYFMTLIVRSKVITKIIKDAPFVHKKLDKDVFQIISAHYK